MTITEEITNARETARRDQKNALALLHSARALLFEAVRINGEGSYRYAIEELEQEIDNAEDGMDHFDQIWDHILAANTA